MTTIRTFRAASIGDALALVRQEMGSDALILGHREVRRRKLPWQRSRVEMEITAGVGPGTPGASLPSDSHTSPGTTLQRTNALRPSSIEARFPEKVPAGSAPASDRQTIRDEISPVADSHQQATPATFPARDPFHLYTRLIEQDVDEGTAREVVREYQHRLTSARQQEADAIIQDILQERLPARGAIRVTPGRARIIALVGATGVGKTTTIAKLAANFRLHDHLRVGLITVDTFRVAAVDQLKTYADLIDVPMKVVNSHRDMQQAVDDFASMDLVLVDTAGRSPQDELRIQELRGFLQAARADEVHLVLSLTSARANLAFTTERFQRVGPTAVLLTKLDEAPAAGAILSAMRHASLPVSYLTTGQDVPDDIEAAETTRLARLVLGDDARRGRAFDRTGESLSARPLAGAKP